MRYEIDVYCIGEYKIKANRQDTYYKLFKIESGQDRVRVKSYPHPTATRSLTPCNHDE